MQTMSLGSTNSFIQGLHEKRKPSRRNIVYQLFDREYGLPSQPISPQVSNKKIYQSVVPNFSIENVERPNCYLRKFTYDGRYLVAFSSDITGIEIFEFQGPAAGAHLLANVPSDQDFLAYRGEEVNTIRRNIFKCFFRHIHSIPVTQNNETLNRECSLFCDDNRHIIVASSTTINEENASFHDRYQNNESFPISTRLQLDDYTFHMVDYLDGRVTDRVHFKTDKIYISYNHGIYLFKDKFAILSVQHQTIYLYHISSTDGKFIPIRKIGRFCYGTEDEYLIQAAYGGNTPRRAGRWTRNKLVSPFREVPYGCLKHRIMTFLFKQAQHEAKGQQSRQPIIDFYKHFKLLVGLKMWKMQLLDEDHLLIKYEQEDTLLSKEISSFIKDWTVFVVYNWKTTEVLNVLPQHSTQIVWAYENLFDFLRYPFLRVSSPSNNFYARKSYLEMKKSLLEAKNGSYKESVRVLLTMLPNNAQYFTPSPYIELGLFSFDEKVICWNERPRQAPEVPVRFFDRQSGRLSFRLHTGQVFLPPPPVNRHLQMQMVPFRRLVAFIFHPTDPFVISVQRYNSHYLVHFHLHHLNLT